MAKPKANKSGQSSRRDQLPFEPRRESKKAESKTGSPKSGRPSGAKPSAPATPANPTLQVSVSPKAGIPEVVSRRMVRRMVITSGIPAIFGIFTFLVSYQVVSRGLIDLPPVAVLLVSLGFFGLSVLGLSYGAFSASWDEARNGGIVGWSEFRTNVQRMTQAWQSEQKS